MDIFLSGRKVMFGIRRSFLLLVVAFSVNGHCQEKVLPPPPPQPVIVDENARALDNGAVLDARQLSKFMGKAEAGDGAAAYRLASHFISIQDSRRSQYWQLFAAAREFPAAQYNLWFDLKDKEDCSSKVEALVWLRIAALNGSAQAREEMKYFPATVDECF
ncbi:hypothetical protein [Xanthomonas sp. 1678]|uniref:hypothetical protein n=1 Tax=Xanthomonas sp. 1678 TaxID=3158788 RepID=UPI002857B2AE|nr:hypothetical protein [Xanthomonas translucens]